MAAKPPAVVRGIFPHPLRAGEIVHAVPFEGKDIVVVDAAARNVAP
jgi:hypothetical protein